MSQKLRLWLAVSVLLIAAAAIISRADQLAMWFDEIWTVFHSSTHLQQILAERDVTWPPGYFLVLHAWARVASWNDFSLHALGAFFGLLTTALLIRAGRELSSLTAGLLAALAFATSSYAIYFILEVRGYSLMLLMASVFVVVYLRWLRKPSLARSILLLITQIVMLYTHFILAVVIALVFIHLIGSVCFPLRGSWRRLWNKLWRWLIIAALTSVALLPMEAQIARALSLRGNLAGTTLPNYFTYDFSSFYQAFSAHGDVWFAVILVLCAIGWVVAFRRIGWQNLLWLAVWGLAIPVFAYITRAQSAIFTTRYLSFTLPAIFLLIGIGLANLPIRRAGPWIGAAVLLILAFAPWQPYDHRPQPSDDGPPLHEFVREMAKRWQPGDMLVVDPGCCQYDDLAWWYYQQLYFPQGQIPRAADGTQAGRRIWYLVRQGREDKKVEASVENGRLNTNEFWGPWYFIATLYEGPPASQGLLFGDSLRFHGADIVHRHGLHAGDTIKMTLWWSVDKPIPPELSMSLQLADPNGHVVAQLDGLPKMPDTPDQLDKWVPNTLYLDERELQVPYQLSEGDYTLNLIVYKYQDGTRLHPERDATSAMSLVIDKVKLYSFAAW